MKLSLVLATVAILTLGASAGCPSASQLGSLCGRIYPHNHCSGTSREVPKHVQVRSLGSFNDQASSLVVAAGCKFTIYQHGGFGGHSRSMFGGVYASLAYVNRGGWWATSSNWNDVISSYKCTCTNVNYGGRNYVAKGGDRNDTNSSASGSKRL